MAQSSPPWKSANLCRYFANGVCRQGISCKYSHDRSSAPDLACRFYQKGQCAYGDRCRYNHVKQDSKGKPSSKGDLFTSKKVNSVVFDKDANPLQSRMVPLTKAGSHAIEPLLPPCAKSPEDWVKAKEFVPGKFYDGAVPSSYAKAVKSSVNVCEDSELMPEFTSSEAAAYSFSQAASQLLCPFFAQGVCHYGDECSYTHGDVCDLCGLALLHPTNHEQREAHNKECILEHEFTMELSFAVARSQDKCCGICMETIMEKEPSSEQRFGILENCNHCFCLSCIRKWRCAKQFEKIIVKACPECRVKSDFVTPSQFWVDTPEEKEQLIKGYKQALRDKPCRYFDQGKGECPFNDKCFYRHALPDGTLAKPQPWKPRRKQNADGEFEFVARLSLWDFLEEDDFQRSVLAELEEDIEILWMNILAHSSDDESI